MEKQIIEYELTADDAAAYYEWETFERPFARRFWRAVQWLHAAMAIGWLAAIWLLPAHIFVVLAPAPVLWAIGLPLAWLYPTRRWRPRMLRAFHRRFTSRGWVRCHFGPVRLEVTPTGIHHTTPTGEIFTPWRGYLRVEPFADRLIFRRVADGLMPFRWLTLGFPIPRRAFDRATEFDEFLESVRQQIRLAGA
jgi:hypothetical protein